MKIQLGTIGRPNGFRGEFMLAQASSEPFSPKIEVLYLGPNEAEATAHRVLGVTPMPSGTRLKLEGFDSDTQVKASRGWAVFADRDALEAPEEGEFLVADLLGSEVRDQATDEVLGALCSVETVGKGCPDRWWIEPADGKRFAVPAAEPTIAAIDFTNRKIWVSNGIEFRSFA